MLILTALLLSSANATCPTSWMDAGVPIADPDPPSPPGTTPLTVDGLHDFVLAEGLGSVAEVLEHMPPAMLKNYALVEDTLTGGLASVDHPRLLLFGSDSRFLVAVPSHPNDPLRERLDIAELDDATGMWIFRSLDMDTNPPTLSPDDSQCTICHGDPARPIWGSYPNWPGMFGEVQDELTQPQADFLQGLQADQSSSDRFHTLELDTYYAAGRSFTLPGRSYAYTNTVINMELGAAVADGAFTRMRNTVLYDLVWKELLIMSYCNYEVPGFYSSPAYATVQSNLAALGAQGSEVEDIYRLLGVDPDNDFSLDRLTGATPHPNWNVSTDSLFGLVDLLVLVDAARSLPPVRNYFLGLPHTATPFSAGCLPTVGEEAAYKWYQAFRLRGEARQAAREARFDVDLLRSHQGILDQAPGMCNALINAL